jgi:NAD+ synthase
MLEHKISIWLNDYLENNNMNCFVVGISGGIDSALTSTLCAMTGKKTIVLSMPIHQKSNQLIRAHNHINWLKTHYNNVESYEYDLTNTFETFKNLFELHDPLVLANSRSRLRMVTLYQVAGSHKGLVVGTGNKIEDFGVGFFTKYGDGGVDISPIADLTKSEVRTLSKKLNILEDIINAAPTDGLWEDDRTDEDQLGATYEELERAMQFNDDVSLLNDRELEVFNIYNKFNKQNQHKMNPIPVFKKSNNVLFDPIEQAKFESNFGNEILVFDYPIDSNSVIVDFGAHIGEWAKQMEIKYNPNIYLVEPLSMFCEELKYKFQTNDKVQIIQSGISNYNGVSHLYLQRMIQAISKYDKTDNVISINVQTPDNILKLVPHDVIDILQINIEGEEYNVLESMIATGCISRIKYLQVQFHKIFIDSVERRNNIHAKLKEFGFELKWNYEFIWESWINKNI